MDDCEHILSEWRDDIIQKSHGSPMFAMIYLSTVMSAVSHVVTDKKMVRTAAALDSIYKQVLEALPIARQECGEA